MKYIKSVLVALIVAVLTSAISLHAFSKNVCVAAVAISGAALVYFCVRGPQSVTTIDQGTVDTSKGDAQPVSLTKSGVTGKDVLCPNVSASK